MSLVRSIATVSGFTLLSRLLGFCRDILIAGMLGAGGMADAFFVAFKFPNLFRRLFGEARFPQPSSRFWLATLKNAVWISPANLLRAPCRCWF